MKLDRWKQFIWNLPQLAEPPTPLTGGLLVRASQKSDEAAIQSLTARAFSFDDQWSGSYRRIAEALQIRIHEAFRIHPNAAITIAHGNRIIAASCMTTDTDADNHLFTGPCVLPEYRSRGLGSALLLHSLHHLRKEGVHVARAVCKDATTAAKFIYPKFGSVSEDYDLEPFSALS
jgi:predicted N-acetyltransferase YhbS